MNVTIKIIPHTEQVYPTVGDWRFDENGNLNIYISEMGNWKYEMLVAVHELCEVIICKNRNISTEEVDTFDKEFENLRQQFPKLIGDIEPGNMSTAPYYKEHVFATVVEKALANELKVDWELYDKTVNKL
jgi:hypothetical protein